MKYRIPEPGTTISGFADNKNFLTHILFFLALGLVFFLAQCTITLNLQYIHNKSLLGFVYLA
jgi:hypothetical protein